MRTSLVVLVAVATALAVPSAAPGQLPKLPPPPKLPPAPALPPVPKVPPLPSVPDLPDSPQLPVPQPAPPTPPAPPPAAAPTSAPAPATSASAPAAGGGSASGGSGDAPAVPGTTTTTVTGTSGSSSPGRTATDRRRAERRLLRAVQRVDACLDELPAGERRVLALRTGLGPARPRSRRSVADALDVGVGRVHRLERRGLRRARGLARAGVCGGSQGAAASPRTSDGAPLAGPAGAPEHGAVADEPAQRQVRLVSEREASPGDSDGGASQPGSGIRIPLLGGASAGTPIAIALGLILLAAVAGFGTPHLRDRLR
jgi:sigma-70-like protein